MTTDIKRTSVDASLELIAAVPRTADQLEQDAFRLLDALNGNVAEIALGATVACNFEKSIIDLLFTVEATSTADVHRKISEVTDVIEHAFSQDEVRARTAPSAVCH
jgi:hypothetical protein